MATFTVGQRVAILVGSQAADGPSVGSYGTVTAVTETWRGQFDYVVAPEDGGEALVYPAYLLQNAHEDAASDYAARARSMAAHPAGKGRKADAPMILASCDRPHHGHRCGMPVRVASPTARFDCGAH